MFGNNLEPFAMQCVVCGTWIAMRLDADDLARHRAGVPVRFAFADRNGVPYLDAASRELWISGVCGSCWSLLCPDPTIHPTAYN